MRASVFISFGDSSYREMRVLEGRNLYSLQRPSESSEGIQRLLRSLKRPRKVITDEIHIFPTLK